MRRASRSRASFAVLLAVAGLLTSPAPGAASSTRDPPLAQRDWVWPLESFRLDRVFEAPAHRYGPGHRGIDLRADPAIEVRAPAGGTVAFSGDVAGRGILTIDHGAGLVTTLEPVESDLAAGSAVVKGDAVATVTVGGHSAPGALHFGVRLDGEYINPLLLLGELPRAVLLPCC